MTTDRTDDTAVPFDVYLPAVLRPEDRPGPIEWLVTKPFRRERAARLDSK